MVDMCWGLNASIRLLIEDVVPMLKVYTVKSFVSIDDGEWQKVGTNRHLVTDDATIGCQKILREFMKTIDLENGIEVGKHLFVFYDKLVKMLYKVNRKRDLDMLEEVINELKTLRSAFLGAIDIAAKEKSGSLIDSDTEA